ncbi:MAG: alpha-L-fucosidase [Chthonomonadales bacterium]|nr:alpha-L-fucosidase [Chthonomonadales bacterium]
MMYRTTGRTMRALFGAAWLAMALGAVGAPKETPAEFEKRTRWWREARFGMFIHWGVYAEPASAAGGAEWYLSGSQVQVRDYEKFAGQFNPVRFDAAAWVRMAREAGMKYIVITSKHHDGFCMFDSALTDWTITKATPFQRDPLKELARECRKQGIRLCFYHSIMDWHHPDYLPRRAWETTTRPADGASLNRYIDYMKGQIRELLTGYGPIGVLWFDGGWEHTAEELRSEEVNAMIRQLQPGIIINDRNQLPADFSTPEQTIPSRALPDGRLWETCMTINDTWGYTRDNTNWKSTGDLIHKLCDIAHKGGNFLLNVGPTELGEFPKPIVERLRSIGAWMKANGASIYGASRSPWRQLSFDGRCTVKGDRLYLHVFRWPDADLSLRGLRSRVRSVRVLATGERLTASPSAATDEPSITISRPRTLDPVATVVEVRCDGPVRAEDPSMRYRPDPSGRLTLHGGDAEIRGSAQLEGPAGEEWVGYWTRPADYVSWEIETDRRRRYRLDVTYACAPGFEGSRYVIGVGSRGVDGSASGSVAPTGSWREFRTDRLTDTITLPEGRQTITVRAVSMPRGAVMNLRTVTLTPEE